MRLINAEHFLKRVLPLCVVPNELKKNVDAEPTVDAVPVVHGHWDCIDNDGNVWRCSVCGEDWMLNDGTPNENNMNFCTRCGAKMDGDRNAAD